jgi:FkbM family methyltransferase
MGIRGQMLKNYDAWFGKLTLDPEIDFYGDSFWQSISQKTYEPDTMAFLETYVDANTDFIDVGAATGAMSFIAASLGARVLAFEAIPRVFEIAQLHLSCNPKFANQVNLQNKAISSRPGTLQLGKKADPSVLASISNEEVINPDESKIEVASLIQEINSFHNQDNKLVIKIDIEGAEWKLLSDKETLAGLQREKALILLAIHPGFNRPFKELPFGITAITKKFWQIQNLLVAYFFFKRLLMSATLRRTSFDKIKSAKKCTLLMFGGYFEFIINFAETQ